MDRPEPVELSAADVQALRQAEKACCRHVRGKSSLWLSLDLDVFVLVAHRDQTK